MSALVTDCLVFKLEEVEEESGLVDNTLYIIYDKRNHNYIIRGQRRSTPNIWSCTYSFLCEYAHELADFIQYVICKYNRVNETLLNYDNLPENSDDITFEFLNECDNVILKISITNTYVLPALGVQNKFLPNFVIH